MAQVVSENYFAVTGVNPAIGRFFSDAQEPPSIVISNALWERLGRDTAVLGASWNINDRLFRIVGVAPKGLNGITAGLGIDCWVPVRDANGIGIDPGLTDRRRHVVIGLGRLKPGATAHEADANIRLLGEQLAAEYPATNKNFRGATFPATLVPGPVRRIANLFAALLLTVMTLVLSIGCANAANVLLARASGRSREMAVRSALGASRRRLIWQTLNDSVVLALISGAAGYIASAFVAPVLFRLRPANVPMDLDVSPDWRVGAFIFGFSLVTGIVFGFLPAVRGTRVDLIETMKSGAHGTVPGRSHLRSGLIVAQVAVCFVLLVAGVLCVRSLQAAATVRPGFNPDHLFVSTVRVGPFGYTEDRGQQLFRNTIERLSAAPDAQSVSMSDHLPLSGRVEGLMIQVPGKHAPQGAPGWLAEMAVVAPGYFRTMDIRLLNGRDFSWADSKNSPAVVVINEELARELWEHENPVGKQITLDEFDRVQTAQVIGVVETGKYDTLAEEPTPFFYQPVTQRYGGDAVFIVRTAGDPAAFAPSFRAAIREMDARLALVGTGTMRQSLEVAMVSARITGVLLGIAGMLALLLALAGIYGLIGYVVAQRTHEIGVRMALGASDRHVFSMVLGYSLKLAGIGVGIGFVLAIAATRVLSGFLYGIGANDGLTFGGVVIGLMTLAIAASYVPARAAMRMSPMEALRYD